MTPRWYVVTKVHRVHGRAEIQVRALRWWERVAVWCFMFGREDG